MESDFAEYYCADNGHPIVPIRKMVGIMLMAAAYNMRHWMNKNALSSFVSWLKTLVGRLENGTLSLQSPLIQNHLLQILFKETFVNCPFGFWNILVCNRKKEDAGAGHVQRLAYSIEGAFCREGGVVLYTANCVC